MKCVIQEKHYSHRTQMQLYPHAKPEKKREMIPLLTFLC